MTEIFRKHHTIACCGIDCGLCPRVHTQGDSACPGCGGNHFKDKHPSCGVLTCCVVKHGKEVCGECAEFPCARFDPKKAGVDSFVTHQKLFANLEFIKKNGMGPFLKQQKTRMNILNDFLAKVDDGRSKSFFCIACALLPVETLQEVHKSMKNLKDTVDTKAKNKKIKEILNAKAKSMKMELKLGKKWREPA